MDKKRNVVIAIDLLLCEHKSANVLNYEPINIPNRVTFGGG